MTTSPQANLADLFLDNLDVTSTQLQVGRMQRQVDRTFSTLLDNNLRKVRERVAHPAAAALESLKTEAKPIMASGAPAALVSEARRIVRQSPVEELEDQVETLGLPLESMALNEEDVVKLKEIMEDSGFTEKQVLEVLEKLAEGPLTMGRVLAALTSVQTKSEPVLKITRESLPSIGQFLEELGFSAEEVKDVLAGLEPGQSFTAETFQSILIQYGRQNLKGPILGNVDQENLKQMLQQMGISEKDLTRLQAMMEKTGGRISLEGFSAFLKSVERPEPLTTEQMETIQQVVKNLNLRQSLKVRPHFNRIVSLLHAMGDQSIDNNFMTASPAIQALRGGAQAAKNVMQGTGIMGQGSAGGLVNGDGGSGSTSEFDTWGDSGSRTFERSAGARMERAALPSRLSAGVARQVAEKMVYQARNNQHRLQIELSPKHLGRININMVVKNNGVQATIVAENLLVKEALEDQVAFLRNQLSEQGLVLERFDVSLGRDRQQGWSFEQGNGRFSLNGDDETAAPARDGDPPIPAEDPQVLNRAGRVDLMA